MDTYVVKEITLIYKEPSRVEYGSKPGLTPLSVVLHDALGMTGRTLLSYNHHELTYLTQKEEADQ